MRSEDLSVIAIYSAMTVYALALIAFSIDLSVRTKHEVEGTRSVLFQRLGIALATLALVMHGVSALFRGLAAGRVPWANMYEFAMVGTFMMMTVFLLAQKKLKIAFLGSFVVSLVLLLLGAASVNFYVPIVPLQPALQSLWLVIHVFVATTAVGFFSLGCALSVLNILKTSRLEKKEKRVGRVDRLLASFPDSVRLELLAYRVTIIGFVLWTFTLIAGAIWAEKAWGRYWGWDTKEVWTFIIWVIYAGYIHARSTQGWNGSRASWLIVTGFAAVMFNFTIVNIFFKGLHTYSGL